MPSHRVETQNRGFVDISMGAMLPAFFAELFLVNFGCSCTSFLKKPHEALPAHQGQSDCLEHSRSPSLGGGISSRP